MSDYRTAMDDFDKNIAFSKTATDVGTIPVEFVESVPKITSYEKSSITVEIESTSGENRIYLEPKKVIVNTYRFKK